MPPVVNVHPLALMAMNDDAVRHTHGEKRGTLMGRIHRQNIEVVTALPAVSADQNAILSTQQAQVKQVRPDLIAVGHFILNAQLSRVREGDIQLVKQAGEWRAIDHQNNQMAVTIESEDAERIAVQDLYKSVQSGGNLHVIKCVSGYKSALEQLLQVVDRVIAKCQQSQDAEYEQRVAHVLKRLQFMPQLDQQFNEELTHVQQLCEMQRTVALLNSYLDKKLMPASNQPSSQPLGIMDMLGGGNIGIGMGMDDFGGVGDYDMDYQ